MCFARPCSAAAGRRPRSHVYLAPFEGFFFFVQRRHYDGRWYARKHACFVAPGRFAPQFVLLFPSEEQMDYLFTSFQIFGSRR